jgi:hypothetical protein
MAGYDQNSVSLERFNDASFFSRRRLLQASAAVAAGLSALVGALSWPENVQASDSNPNVLGRRPGYAPQVGTFVSLQARGDFPG